MGLGEALGDRAGVAASLINLGSVHNSLGASEQALELVERGLRAAEEVRHQRWANTALGLLGSIHADRGEYSKSLEYHQRALAMRRAAGWRADVVGALISLGNLYLQQNEDEQRGRQRLWWVGRHRRC